MGRAAASALRCNAAQVPSRVLTSAMLSEKIGNIHIAPGAGNANAIRARLTSSVVYNKDLMHSMSPHGLNRDHHASPTDKELSNYALKVITPGTQYILLQNDADVEELFESSDMFGSFVIEDVFADNPSPTPPPNKIEETSVLGQGFKVPSEALRYMNS